METTDKTFIEMQEQLQALKSKLNEQRIVNDRVLRNSYRNGLRRLNLKSNVPIFAAFAFFLISPAMVNIGLSWYFIGFTIFIMLAAVVATFITKTHLPRMDKDLVSMTKELTTFRKINADWYKVGVPVLVIWLGWMTYEAIYKIGLSGEAMYPFLGGVVIGLVIGGFLGFKNRKDILDGTDELLEQIDELVNNG